MKQRGKGETRGRRGIGGTWPSSVGADLGGCNSPTEFTNQACSWTVLPRRGFHRSGEGPGSGREYEQHSPSDEHGGSGQIEGNAAAFQG